MGHMSKQRITNGLALIGALTLLAVLAFQYPLSTTFPIGGDAAFYIRVGRTLSSNVPLMEKIALFKSSSYPLAYVVAAGGAIFPIDWPERFIWLVTLTYIAVGGCLGFFLYRLKNTSAAAAAIAIWALIPIDITTHLEDGTLAQLLSLVFLALFFERLSALSWWGIILTYGAVLLSHPLTGLVLFLTVLATTLGGPLLFRTLPSPQRRIYQLLTGLTLLSVGAIAYKLWMSPALVTTAFTFDATHFALPDLAQSVLGPFLLLSVLGFFTLLKQPRENQLIKIVLIAFCIITILLSFNYLLGVGLLTYRFKSYFVFGIVVLSALAISEVVQTVFPLKFLRYAFGTILFTSLAAASWHNNDRVYRYYEAPGNYARLHPGEYKGILWMKNNLPSNSVIITSTVNRHPEWIPVLTNLQWLSLPDINDEAKINDTLHEARIYNRPVYVALLLNAEEVPPLFSQRDAQFGTVDFMVIQVRQ